MYRIIRAVTKDQLTTIKRLDRKIFPKDLKVKLSDAICWIVMKGKTPVGFAILSLHPTYGFFRRAGVFESEWGRNLHQRLIRVRLAYLKSIGYTLALTYVSNENLRSANSLSKAGFNLYMPQEKYVGPNVVYMEWRDKTK